MSPHIVDMTDQQPLNDLELQHIKAELNSAQKVSEAARIAQMEFANEESRLKKIEMMKDEVRAHKAVSEITSQSTKHTRASSNTGRREAQEEIKGRDMPRP